jgi:hypothetical protein
VRTNRFEHLLKNLRNTQDAETSCSECFNLVSHFVEVEVSGEDASAKMPRLVQHLAQCPACRQEYETLRDLQILENNDELLAMVDLQGLIS